VRALNAAWRGKDKPTNVLSFPMVEPDRLGRPGETMLGDIVLAHGICAAEAAEKGVAIETHASHLVVHGALHLLGYDHETTDADADAMEETERRALASIGIADPYRVTEVNT
jgi:probable rRNA maturation factor